MPIPTNLRPGHADAKSSAPKSDNEELTAEAFRDALQTFEATQETCRRLDKWAAKELADPSISLPIHDLVQYCEATIQQCHSYLVHKTPMVQSNFVQDQVWRGLGALGFDPSAKPEEYGMHLLDLLLAECRRRTLEVVKLMDEKWTQVSREEPYRGHRKPEVHTHQAYNYDRFFAAVTAVHDNIGKGDSLYSSEKRHRAAKEVEEHILPELLDFGNKLAECDNFKGPPTNDIYPEREWVQTTVQDFLWVS